MAKKLNQESMGAAIRKFNKNREKICPRCNGKYTGDSCPRRH